MFLHVGVVVVVVTAFTMTSVTRLGNFLETLARINLPKSPTFLGNFSKVVKIYHFSTEIIFGQLLQTFGDFFVVTLTLTLLPEVVWTFTRCSRWSWKLGVLIHRLALGDLLTAFMTLLPEVVWISMWPYFTVTWSSARWSSSSVPLSPNKEFSQTLLEEVKLGHVGL